MLLLLYTIILHTCKAVNKFFGGSGKTLGIPALVGTFYDRDTVFLTFLEVFANTLSIAAFKNFASTGFVMYSSQPRLFALFFESESALAVSTITGI